MLKELSDLAPKAVVAAVLCWGGLNYFVIAPEAASRIVRADYLPQCESHIGEMAQISANARIADVPKPVTSRRQDMAAQQLGRLKSGMLGQLLNDPAMESMFGFSAMTDMALAEVQDAKAAATAVYQDALTSIKVDTARMIEGASGLCGCAANAAIDDTRNEWAMLTGSLGLFQPMAIKAFDKRLQEVLENGACAKTGAQ